MGNLRENVGKTRWGKTIVLFGMPYCFPDLDHILLRGITPVLEMSMVIMDSNMV